MKLERIKPGHTYYAPVEVTKITNGDVHVAPIHVYQPEELEELPNPYRHVHSECSSTELTKLLKIKSGDRVKVVARFGFKPWTINWNEELETSEDVWVVDKVDAYGFVQITRPQIALASVFFVFLDLVAAKEELEPYSVQHSEAHAAWSIYGPFSLSAVNYFYGERYPYTKESAKAAATAECARLNAEYARRFENEYRNATHLKS